ncbi:DNA translocase FtsK [Vannielia sp.]|uniref:DNA translocase FtsK n=1 Tax=Vannielia sp. TaxID=2813045 RepID=UPI0026292FCF|nr:DNA translocase FtsK [Vannielia sp.]MDF1871053.1 DNA translocase FtsK 4TM domain-containing protein [Vannielia sp.]
MAYQAKQRDPLFDSNMQAAIERRGRELAGLGMLGAALLIALILGSYVPDDPSWLSATDDPAQNLLGRFGASVAGPLFIIVGYASWTIPVILAAWGLRFTRHLGSERALGRLIFAPIAIAAAAIYGAMLSPGTGWTHSFGLGGLFGDTVLGALLTILPFGAGAGVRVLAIPMGLGALALVLFAVGCTRPEMQRFGRFLMVGMIVAYAGVAKLLGKGAEGSLGLAQSLRERRAARRDAALLAEASAPAPQHSTRPDFTPRPLVVREDDPVIEPLAAPAAHVPEKKGLLAQVTGFVKRAEPELVTHDPVLEANAGEAEAPTDERIKARISDAIRQRARGGQAVRPALTNGLPAEPPLRARAPQPLVVNTRGAVPPAPMAMMDDAVEGEAAATPPMATLPPVPPLMAEPLAYAPAPEEAASPPQPAAASYAAPPVPEPRAVVQHPPRKTVQPSRRAQAEAQPALAFEEQSSSTGFELPPLSLLGTAKKIDRASLSDEALEENARMLESVLDDYGVRGEIVSVRPGPVVTMYELEPAPGLKASRVIGLADDIARSMSALAARVSTVPGRSVIGIELPNDQREMVNFREILSGRDYGDGNHRLPLALGKDIGGEPVVANLAKMPHLLIAGTTGSGKSVAINTMILSLLYKLSPDELRLVMIDPKMLELSVYDGIPHLLSPVVTDPKKAVVALKWVVGEMEDRYRKMSKMGVRNIEGYNARVRETLSKGELFSRTIQTGFDDDTGEPVFETEEFKPETLPFIVVIVDEMADLMMVAGKEIEACIQRLAQMARASGIHLIMATQRPSVDVITGTIKANFQVTSKIDSRTILGEMGAEQLLGMGDMLYMAGGGRIQRVHGPFVSDEEVEEVVNHLKSFGVPEYVSGVVDGPEDDKENDIDLVLGLGGNTDGEDALYDQAVQIVIQDRKCSTSYIQRKLAIGYNKAARLVEQMEDNGLVTAANHVGKREILAPEPQ